MPVIGRLDRQVDELFINRVARRVHQDDVTNEETRSATSSSIEEAPARPSETNAEVETDAKESARSAEAIASSTDEVERPARADELPVWML